MNCRYLLANSGRRELPLAGAGRVAQGRRFTEGGGRVQIPKTGAQNFDFYAVTSFSIEMLDAQKVATTLCAQNSPP